MITEDLLKGRFVDPLSVVCHGRGLYHTLPSGSTSLASLAGAPICSLERGEQGPAKKGNSYTIQLLPSTSNAVERGNWRYRKMQKSVYRVRTQEQISTRLALDMWREAQAEGRQQTLASLHRARAG
jgi:hypothetical protein